MTVLSMVILSYGFAVSGSFASGSVHREERGVRGLLLPAMELELAYPVYYSTELSLVVLIIQGTISNCNSR